MALRKPDGILQDATRKRPLLTRERMLDVAIALVDAEGVDALTMRRLGKELDRDPMALYRHAPNRAALLDGVVEAIFEKLDIPHAESDWQAQLRLTARNFRELGVAHPHLVPLLVTRPLTVPIGLRPKGTLRPLESILELLIHAGFAPVDALHIYRVYFGFLSGHVLTEMQELIAHPDETENLLRLGLHHLPPKEFPRVRGLASELAGYDGPSELEKGLDVLFVGLTAQLHGNDETV